MRKIFSLWVIFVSGFDVIARGAVILKTSSPVIKGISTNVLHDFLSTPQSWPRIVASSSSVEGPNIKSPMKNGDVVDEIFGLPPLLPLRVSWKCDITRCEEGLLEVISPTGLEGIASNCKMKFEVQDGQDRGSPSAKCDFEMSYETDNILAMLAIPILALDNALALKILLPAAISADKENELLGDNAESLNKFRQLMGFLYGFAGLAHFADLLVGGSQLITAAGAPTFENLPPAGQAFAFLWCLCGPFAYITSKLGGRYADVGLLAYGLVEVSGAMMISYTYPLVDAGIPAVLSAAGVQVAVILSWLYTRFK